MRDSLRRPFWRPALTEIYLCNICSCQHILSICIVSIYCQYILSICIVRNIETQRPRPPGTQATSSLAPGGPLTRARKRGQGKGRGKGKDGGKVKRVAKLSGGQSKAATPAPRGGGGGLFDLHATVQSQAAEPGFVRDWSEQSTLVVEAGISHGGGARA
eukprot:COSAG01_NODE_803_length_13459_cov_9.995808_10_plen_159_part_00